MSVSGGRREGAGFQYDRCPWGNGSQKASLIRGATPLALPEHRSSSRGIPTASRAHTIDFDSLPINQRVLNETSLLRRTGHALLQITQWLRVPTNPLQCGRQPAPVDVRHQQNRMVQHHHLFIGPR
jgi:hypothetical protein